MGVFDSILNGISDNLGNFFSGSDSLGTYLNAGKDALAIGGALGVGGSGSVNNSQSLGQVKSADYLSAHLQQGVIPLNNRIQTQLPTHSRDEFQAAQGADPNTIESEWNNRLQRYADVSRMTGVSETGR